MPLDGPPGLRSRHFSIPKRPHGVDSPTHHIPNVVGTWNTLVILVDFLDYRWNNGHDPNFYNPDSSTTYVPSHYTSMLFSTNTYKDPFAVSQYTGSLRDYYAENSYGRLQVTGTVVGWYHSPHTYKYYCNTDGLFGTADDYGWAKSDSAMVWDLVHDAVLAADPSVDFSRYDNDGDGVVDGLFIVHAGPGAEAVYGMDAVSAAGDVWSHKWQIPNLYADGVVVSNYTIEPEDGRIGVFCHEFGHDLGLIDLYDTDYSTEGIGEWDIMSSGVWCARPGDPLGSCPSDLSAWSKEQLGWVNPVNVKGVRLAQVIPPVETSPTVYRLWANGSLTNEYFLIENRQNIGFDAALTRRQLQYGLPLANGLLIYHIDETVETNADETRRIVDVEEATPFWNGIKWFEQLDSPKRSGLDMFLSVGNRGDNGDPWPGWSAINEGLTDYIGPRSLDAFGPTTVPNSNSNTGAVTNVSVTHIKLSGINVVADLSTALATDVPSLPSTEQSREIALAPVRGNSELRVTLDADRSRLSVRVYDSLGRAVRDLHDGPAEAGTLRLAWNSRRADGSRLPSGVYTVRVEAAPLQAGGSPDVAQRRVVVIR
jgi:immune inhibitor A